jgi:hypothetical protein
MKFSTYAGFTVWGASGFMAQPSIASGIYHLVVLPLLIILTIALAHREGRSAL